MRTLPPKTVPWSWLPLLGALAMVPELGPVLAQVDRGAPATAVPVPPAATTPASGAEGTPQPPPPPNAPAAPAAGASPAERTSKPAAAEKSSTPPAVAPLKPPNLGPEPVRIWQPEGMGEAAPASKPLRRRAAEGSGNVPSAGLWPAREQGPMSLPRGDSRQLPPGVRPVVSLRGPMPPGAIPPGAMPPGAMPPGMMPPGALPPGALPPGVMRQGRLPPGALPPGALPGGAGQLGAPGQRPGAPLGGEKAGSGAWSPWASLGAGLVLASGVIVVLTTTRKRRELAAKGDDLPPDF